MYIHSIYKIFFIFGLMMQLFPFSLFAQDDGPLPESIHSLGGKTIEGKELSFKEYDGKALLIVNTASKCGFTPQYADLEELYKKYKDQGLVVLGFPSNDFMKQEPGTNEEIAKFCKLRFGVTFPLFEKAPVTTGEKQPVFKYLTEESPKKFRGKVKWNFEKFLINKEGQVVARFGSFTNPLSTKVRKKIEEVLG